MHGYNSFRTDIEEVFKPLIIKYHFTCVSEYEDTTSCSIVYVKLKNDVFGIEFSLDRMDLLIELIDEKNKQSYVFNQVVEYLFPESNLGIKGDESKNSYSSDYIKSCLNSCFELLSNYLQKVIEGDFTWGSNLQVIIDDKNKMFKQIMQLKYNHPLYQQTMNGKNKDWYEQAKEYFEKNG